MSKKNSISVFDRIFKFVFSEQLRKMHITSYEQEVRSLKKDIIKLKKIVAYDSLTGALSYMEFKERVEYFLSLFKRFSFKKEMNQSFSIVFIDVDKFKSINDTYGHDAGDNILINLVKFIKEQLRDSDFIGRMGGDEFLIFLEESNLDSSLDIMNNIKSRLRHTPLSIGDKEIEIGISFGVSSTSEGISDLKKLTQTADRRMYKQKNEKGA